MDFGSEGYLCCISQKLATLQYPKEVYGSYIWHIDCIKQADLV